MAPSAEIAECSGCGLPSVRALPCTVLPIAPNAGAQLDNEWSADVRRTLPFQMALEVGHQSTTRHSTRKHSCITTPRRRRRSRVLRRGTLCARRTLQSRRTSMSRLEALRRVLGIWPRMEMLEESSEYEDCGVTVG